MPDHVHLFLKTNPNFRPCDIVGQIKGESSYVLRQEYIKLKKQLPTLWTRSYYIESIGHISAHTIKKYIDNQKRNNLSEAGKIHPIAKAGGLSFCYFRDSPAPVTNK